MNVVNYVAMVRYGDITVQPDVEVVIVVDDDITRSVWRAQRFRVAWKLIFEDGVVIATVSFLHLSDQLSVAVGMGPHAFARAASQKQ